MPNSLNKFGEVNSKIVLFSLIAIALTLVNVFSNTSDLHKSIAGLTIGCIVLSLFYWSNALAKILRFKDQVDISKNLNSITINEVNNENINQR